MAFPKRWRSQSLLLLADPCFSFTCLMSYLASRFVSWGGFEIIIPCRWIPDDYGNFHQAGVSSLDRREYLPELRGLGRAFLGWVIDILGWVVDLLVWIADGADFPLLVGHCSIGNRESCRMLVKFPSCGKICWPSCKDFSKSVRIFTILRRISVASFNRKSRELWKWAPWRAVMLTAQALNRDRASSMRSSDAFWSKPVSRACSSVEASSPSHKVLYLPRHALQRTDIAEGTFDSRARDITAELLGRMSWVTLTLRGSAWSSGWEYWP